MKGILNIERCFKIVVYLHSATKQRKKIIILNVFRVEKKWKTLRNETDRFKMNKYK